MHWIWATATSLGFPNLAIKIDFALAYPSDVKGRPSIRALTLGTKKSFREEKLLIALISIFQFVSNWSENRNQARCVPSNFVVASLRSLTWILLFTIISLSSFFFFISSYISLIFNSTSILVLNLSFCISSSFWFLFLSPYVDLLDILSIDQLTLNTSPSSHL